MKRVPICVLESRNSSSCIEKQVAHALRLAASGTPV